MGMDALQVFPCSQAATNQRAGRAGRTGPGVAVFHLPAPCATYADVTHVLPCTWLEFHHLQHVPYWSLAWGPRL